MVDGGMKCVKYLIFFFNFIFVISGIALVAMGAVIKGYYSKYLDFLGDDVISVPVLLIVVGVIIFFVAFMGCCGAIRESHCMTMTFAVLLAIIFILELAAGIAAYVMRDEIRVTLDKNMGVTMQNYGEPNHAGVKKTWDGVQMELNCCGVNSYTDWAGTPSLPALSVPSSCCLVPNEDDCGAGVLDMTQQEAAVLVHTRGCLPAIGQAVHHNWISYVVAAAVFFVIQILGILFGCCLAQTYRYSGYSNVSV